MRAWMMVLAGFVGAETALVSSGMPTWRSYLTAAGVGFTFSVGGAFLIHRHEERGQQDRQQGRQQGRKRNAAT